MNMANTLLIWFDPDQQQYKIGSYHVFKLTASLSLNEDRFEVLSEFSSDTASVAYKIQDELNKARSSSLTLNF